MAGFLALFLRDRPEVGERILLNPALQTRDWILLMLETARNKPNGSRHFFVVRNSMVSVDQTTFVSSKIVPLGTIPKTRRRDGRAWPSESQASFDTKTVHYGMFRWLYYAL